MRPFGRVIVVARGGPENNLVVEEDLDGVRGYVGERERVARHVGGPRQETFARDGAGDDGRVQARRRVRPRASDDGAGPVLA